MSLETWINILQLSFARVLDTVVSFVPNLVVAIVLLILGWIIGAALAKVIEQLFKTIKIDKVLSASGLEEVVNRAGIKLNSGKFIGELIKWFVIIVFLLTSFDVLGLTQVNNFIAGIVSAFIPNVIATVLILLVSVVLAEVLRKTVVASAKAAHLKSANFLGSVTRWSILVFAIIAALIQLGIAVSILQTLFTGIVVALALGLGLAFGLGGKDAAQNYIEKVKKEVSDRE